MHIVRDLSLAALILNNLRNLRIMSLMNGREEMMLDLEVHATNKEGEQ